RERKPRPRAVDLNRLITEMADTLNRLLGERIRLDLDLTPGIPPVCMDPLQVEQILLTLAANSWEAMPEGGTLRLATELPHPPEPRLPLLVSDTGRGMEPEILDHLFNSLWGAGNERVARGGVPGLGLPWAREVVEQAGGKIEVTSRPAAGSTFRLLLPTVEPLALSPLSGGLFLHSLHGAETILLVEDEDELRRPLTELLEDRGYLVLAAGDGLQALTLAAQHDGPLHLLVTDVVLPGMSGQELARELVSLRRETRVIFTTGYPEDVVAEERLRGDGPCSVLKKPFTSQALMQLIQEVLTAG
ncbi:MAG TPA: response regulator, partial [Thermoanaerobaculia bacterium]|nr:response regulator [Thermoanaerobaculia bacterium]